MRRYFFILAFLMVGCSSGDVDELVARDAATSPPTADPPPAADVPPTILPTYNFEIGGVQAGPDMTVDIGGQFQVGIDLGDTLRGSARLDLESTPPGHAALGHSFVTDTGSTMAVTVSGSQTALDGSFTVNVTSDLYTVYDFIYRDRAPTFGTFEVVTPTETVTVTVFTSDGFPAGIEMSLDGGAAVTLTFQDYEDLANDALAETWQRRASLAGAVHGSVFEGVFQIANLLDELEATESAAPIVTACDEFQGTPPAGILLQGEHVLTRMGAGEELSPGDVFDWRSTNCWIADSNSLVDNSMQLQNYIEDIDADNTLTRIGFGPDNNISGGVLFADWTVAQTEEIEGVYTIDPFDRIEINGGFSMVFTEP